MPDHVPNAELLAEIITCRQSGEVSDRLGEMILKMVYSYSRRVNFRSYSYIDEMRSAALIACLHRPTRIDADCRPAVLKFDPGRSSQAFSYVTTVIHNAFIRVLNAERRARDTIDDLISWAGHDPSYGYTERNTVDYDHRSPGPVTIITDHTGYEPPPILGKHRNKFRPGRPAKAPEDRAVRVRKPKVAVEGAPPAPPARRRGRPRKTGD